MRATVDSSNTLAHLCHMCNTSSPGSPVVKINRNPRFRAPEGSGTWFRYQYKQVSLLTTKINRNPGTSCGA
jgi:hypothetical protein